MVSDKMVTITSCHSIQRFSVYECPFWNKQEGNGPIDQRATRAMKTNQKLPVIFNEILVVSEANINYNVSLQMTSKVKFDIRFEISDLKYPSNHAHVASNCPSGSH